MQIMTSCFSFTDTSLHNYELLTNFALLSTRKWGSYRIWQEIINLTFGIRAQKNLESNGTQSSLQDSYTADTDVPSTYLPP